MTNNLTNSALEEPKHWFYCDIRHVSQCLIQNYPD